MMSRLKDLYSAIEVLRKAGLSLDEVEQQIAEAEEDVIKNDILPTITESLSSLLQQVQRELVLVVKYVPGSPVTVHLSRPNGFPSVEPEPDSEPDSDPDPFLPPTTRKLLRIRFADGTVIEEPEVAETFRKFVLAVGVDKVRSVGIIRNNLPLISDTLDSKYKSQQRDLGNGWYLMTCSTTPSKKKDILTIASKLGLDITVEEFPKN
jgi:hypothetical protein